MQNGKYSIIITRITFDYLQWAHFFVGIWHFPAKESSRKIIINAFHSAMEFSYKNGNNIQLKFVCCHLKALIRSNSTHQLVTAIGCTIFFFFLKINYFYPIQCVKWPFVDLTLWLKHVHILNRFLFDGMISRLSTFQWSLIV